MLRVSSPRLHIDPPAKKVVNTSSILEPYLHSCIICWSSLYNGMKACFNTSQHPVTRPPLRVRNEVPTRTRELELRESLPTLSCKCNGISIQSGSMSKIVDNDFVTTLGRTAYCYHQNTWCLDSPKDLMVGSIFGTVFCISRIRFRSDIQSGNIASSQVWVNPFLHGRNQKLRGCINDDPRPVK